MGLHVVVHHRKDPDQPWRGNVWLDDDRLQAIVTTAEIGRLCERAQSRSESVSVHRCALGGIPPTICCTARVQRVASVDRRTALVEFTLVEATNLRPSVQALPGQNSYEA